MSPSAVRERLARHRLQARRDLGQNFLVDADLARKLVRAAEVGPSDRVIEIGPGLGIMTRALAQAARAVTAIEIDAGLVRVLREEGLPENVELIHADVRRVDLAEQVCAAAPAPVRVVANLPYSVSSPVLRRVLDLHDRLAGWAVMLQRELADRLTAREGTRDYGSLTVMHRLCARCERVLDLHPRCFYPAPNVTSAFVRIVPRETPSVAPGELARVEPVIRAAFSKRRKTLANALRGGGREAATIASVIAAGGHDPRVRAEALSPEALLAIARRLAPPEVGASG